MADQHAVFDGQGREQARQKLQSTLAGLPAISVPAGFSDDGLPMGMQLIGPPLGDLAVLNAAAAYEEAIADWLARRPDLS